MRDGTRRTAETPQHRRLSVVCVAVVVVELVLVAVLRGPLVAVAHGVAATTMVAGAIAVMVCSALRVDERHGASASELATAAAYRRTYLALAVTLGVLLALTVVLHLTVSGFGLTVLVAEVVILVLFGAYWVVQTVELWDLGDEEHPEAREVSGVQRLTGRTAYRSGAAQPAPTRPQWPRAPRSCVSVRPSGACRRRVASASPRVAERVTMATGTPRWWARRTKR